MRKINAGRWPLHKGGHSGRNRNGGSLKKALYILEFKYKNPHEIPSVSNDDLDMSEARATTMPMHSACIAGRVHTKKYREIVSEHSPQAGAWVHTACKFRAQIGRCLSTKRGEILSQIYLNQNLTMILQTSGCTNELEYLCQTLSIFCSIQPEGKCPTGCNRSKFLKYAMMNQHLLGKKSNELEIFEIPTV